MKLQLNKIMEDVSAHHAGINQELIQRIYAYIDKTRWLLDDVAYRHTESRVIKEISISEIREKVPGSSYSFSLVINLKAFRSIVGGTSGLNAKQAHRADFIVKKYLEALERKFFNSNKGYTFDLEKSKVKFDDSTVMTIWVNDEGISRLHNDTPKLMKANTVEIEFNFDSYGGISQPSARPEDEYKLPLASVPD